MLHFKTKLHYIYTYDNSIRKINLRVQPKSKMFPSVTHPHFISNLSVFLLLNTKEDIMKNVGEQTAGIFSILWKSMAAVNCLITHIFYKYVILCSTEERNSGLK